MAKVRNNIVIQGLSGSLGDQIVIKQDKAGRTIVGVSPNFDPNRSFSEAQLNRQEKFREAVEYAKDSKNQEVYINKAEGTTKSPYNVAMADWFHGPEILELDVSGWNGGAGEVIRIRAMDNVQVTQVNVVITDGANNVIEQGAATDSAGAWWSYTTTQSAAEGTRIVVTAKDLPGNVAQMNWE